MPTAAADVWASGDAYEPYVGRWSRLVAREFLAWLAVPPGAAWLDVGSGTGALTSIILADAAPARIEAVDPALAYVRFAEQHIRDPRAVFINADAQALPQPTQSIDASVSALALNFVPDPAAALAEMMRVTASGGVVAVYVWDYAGEMQLMRRFWDAAAALDPHAATLDEARRFPICHPAALESLFRGARLQNIESRAIDVPTRFADFEDYWRPFLGGQGPAPTYAMSLSDGRRAALREQIRGSLPIAADGSIALIARAWAVRGRRV